MAPTITAIATDHVDILSSKTFDAAVKDLAAELGKASTEKLMDRLYASDSWNEYAEECADIAGRSNLIEVGQLNWGRVLTLSGATMKARCLIVGNPLTAKKLLAPVGRRLGFICPPRCSYTRPRTGQCTSRMIASCRSWLDSVSSRSIKSPALSTRRCSYSRWPRLISQRGGDSICEPEGPTPATIALPTLSRRTTVIVENLHRGTPWLRSCPRVFPEKVGDDRFSVSRRAASDRNRVVDAVRCLRTAPLTLL